MSSSRHTLLQKIGGFFIHHLKVALLAGIVLCAWGVLATVSISKESAPYIEYGVVTISTVYSGASAIDVDELVTREIEDRIKNISGLDKFSSVSRDGVSMITLEFEPGQDMTKAMGDIRSKVDEAKTSLPAEVDDDPVVTEVDSSLESFLTVVLSGNTDSAELTDTAESLKEILEDIPNVAQVTLQGGKEREIAVEADRQKLEALGLSLNDVANAIRISHQDTPAGDIEVDGFSYAVRFSGKHRTAEDVANVVLRDFGKNGIPSFIRVRDVANVFEREEDTKTISRFVTLSKEQPSECLQKGKMACFVEHVRVGDATTIASCVFALVLFLVFLFPPVLSGNPLPRYLPGTVLVVFLSFWLLTTEPLPQYQKTDNVFENAVELSLSRKSKSDILEADTASKNAVYQFEKERLPANMSLAFTNDAAKNMRDDYKSVIQSGIQSFVIVMLFIFFFVGIREGLVASLVIPITFLVTIGILFFTGRTLNFMTNFSMILALGILVDTAIVIVEGIHHFIRSGHSPREAALHSLREFGAPLISGTLTTVAVFIPLLSLSGVLGQYLSFIPITVIIVLVVSLAISLLVLPAYASFLLKGTASGQKSRWFRKTRLFGMALRKHIDRRIGGVITWYQSLLRVLIKNRFRRLALFAGAVFLFFASFHISIPFVLFPSGDAPFLTISVELPEGIDEQQTLTAAIPVENEVLTASEVKFVRTAISGKTASIYVELLPEEDRTRLNMRNSKELESIFAEKMDVIANQIGASIRVQSASSGPPSDFPVGFRVVAKNRNAIEDSKRFTEELTKLLATIPGTAGVTNDIEEIPGEFQFQVRRDRALALGIDPDSVSGLVRSALQGTTAATITRNARDIDIVVTYPETDFISLADVESLPIRTNSGVSVPLQDIAVVERNNALATVRRSEGDISFTVSSLLAPGGNAAEITEAFLTEKERQHIVTPSGIEVVAAGENEENADLISELSRGLIIAILIMFLILVVQFNAFLQPLLVLFTILFAQIGVSLGLWLTDTPRSLAYILGVIALAGIVVNDSIIMIDRMNENRRARQKDPSNEEEEFVETPEQIKEDIIETGGSRFIPVILTTLTTSAGIIPLIFQDEFWAGLSYTVIFGLMVASFLTLIVTPATYYQIQREPGATFLFVPAAVCLSLALLSLVFSPSGATIVFFIIASVFFGLFRWVCLRNDRERV